MELRERCCRFFISSPTCNLGTKHAHVVLHKLLFFGPFFLPQGFIQGHEDLIYDNDYVQSNQERVDDLFDNCREQLPIVSLRSWNNRFYTPLGNATATCDCCGRVTLAELQKIEPRIEANYTASTIPPDGTIIGWARAKTGLPPQQ